VGVSTGAYRVARLGGTLSTRVVYVVQPLSAKAAPTHPAAFRHPLDSIVVSFRLVSLLRLSAASASAPPPERPETQHGIPSAAPPQTQVTCKRRPRSDGRTAANTSPLRSSGLPANAIKLLAN
jgi:hypothetical protein